MAIVKVFIISKKRGERGDQMEGRRFFFIAFGAGWDSIDWWSAASQYIPLPMANISFTVYNATAK
jgi:hypothetical protein